MIFQVPLWPVDSLSLLMIIIIAAIALLIFIYSISHIKFKFVYYYLALSITLIAMFGTVMARDFLTFFIFIEMMSAGIYFLIIHNGIEFSFRSGYKYILMMLAGGLLILTAAILFKLQAGSYEMSVIAKVAGKLSHKQLATIFTLFFTGCLIKLGAVPFHVWLPDAHPAAPSPISALLSGATIKIGAYGIIRILFILNLFRVNSALIIIGTASMLFGTVLALLQTRIKRLLAYSSVSQMGLIVLGIGIGTELGLVGSLYHILNHAAFKALLFLCAGSVIFATNQRRTLDKLGGLGKQMPFTMLAFTVGALALTGIPPFCGFTSKTLLAQSVAASPVLKFILIITAAGTVAYLYKLFRYTFLGKTPPALKKVKEPPLPMLIPTIILAIICLIIGLFPQAVLNNLIIPITKLSNLVIPVKLTNYNFWNLKLLYDTLIIVALGLSIYHLGTKLGIISAKSKPAKESIFDYMSLDKTIHDLAHMVNHISNRLRYFHAQALNRHMIWVFATLAILLVAMIYWM